jgi:cell division septation protein DedD
LKGVLSQAQKGSDSQETAGQKSPDTPPARAEPPVESKNKFSVPTIGNLEKGKYYLQLGAFNKEDFVEKEIARVGSMYPVLVQDEGNREKPVYRILVGPVNRGESNALLQRFRNMGFSDAFVRAGS